jgi:predicted permease
MSWISRITNALRDERLSKELEREQRFHLAERTDALIALGMTPDAAAHEARKQFGNRMGLKERARDASVLGWLDTLFADVRYALRGLIATPGFTAVAVLSLALGIGANSAIFTLANALVFKTLPVRDPEQLVALKMSGPGGDEFTNPLWEQIRDTPDLLAGSFAYGTSDFNLSDGGEQRSVPGAWVSGDFFSVLGVRAVAGRTLVHSDDVRGCAPVAAVSAGFAQREFGGAEQAVGKSVSLNGHPFTVVGAIDPDFFGINIGRTVDVYTPQCAQTLLNGPAYLDQRSTWYLNVAGRVPAGVSEAQLQTRLRAASPPMFAATVPPRWGAADQKEYLKTTLTLAPAATGFSETRDRYRGALFTLMAVVGVVLLIACANIANLLLARAAAREREIAIRLAIGAGRGRVIRQLLTESLVLASAGAALGLIFAQWAGGLLVGFMSSAKRPLWLDLSLDWRVVAFTTGVAVLTAVLFGLVPAWRATRVDPQAALKAGGRGLAGGRSRHRLGKALVVAQVALSLTLVAAAGLLVNSFRRLTQFDPGFRRTGVLVTHFELNNTGLKDAALDEAKNEILRGARLLPGVTSASLSLLTPIGNMQWNEFVVVPGVTPRNQKDSLVYFNSVADGYFTTLGTSFVAGRDITPDDVAQKRHVAVVNETMAKYWFGTASPIGRSFQTAFGDSVSPPIEVVGVVRDTKYARIDETPLAIAYLPIGQAEATGPFIELVMRSAGDPGALMPAVRKLAAGISPKVSLDFTTLEAQVDASLARPRLLASLSGFMGALALLLAVIGLYGMMSYDVNRRRNEIGIRKALGAADPALWRMVVREAARLIVMGVVIGAVIAVASTRLMNAFLFGLTATDPTTFVAAAVILGGAGIVAAFLPAWRASRMSPMAALREE